MTPAPDTDRTDPQGDGLREEIIAALNAAFRGFSFPGGRWSTGFGAEMAADALIAGPLAQLRSDLRGAEAEATQLRRALGCHIQAEAYRETFPDDENDAADLRKSETWWRLMARCAVGLDSDLADACGSAAHDMPEVLAEIEKAVASARAALSERSSPKDASVIGLQAEAPTPLPTQSNDTRGRGP